VNRPNETHKGIFDEANTGRVRGELQHPGGFGKAPKKGKRPVVLGGEGTDGPHDQGEKGYERGRSESNGGNAVGY